MKLRPLAVIASTASLLTGCIIAAPGHLYPIAGPSAAKSPPAIYSVVVSGIAGSGTLTATLGDNETCSGDWHQVAQSDTSAGQMSAQWDQVYGQGFFVANVLGNPYFAHAKLTCKQGTALSMEFFRINPGSLNATKGVGQDSRGNLYKVTF